MRVCRIAGSNSYAEIIFPTVNECLPAVLGSPVKTAASTISAHGSGENCITCVYICGVARLTLRFSPSLI